jgi:flavoprotein
MKGGVKKIKGGNTLKDLIAPLGTNAFIATGLLIILEKLFTKKVREIKTDDPIKKKLIGGQLLKKREELFNLIAPITFNTFAKKSFLKNLSQISNIKK